eukprot:TRINITY_DN2327_c0_g1_i1.p2 TRINITY_DN2327_c0_g1~~TRINITY_DN2327_c0_g1_i1.p2  ORF type:complete len:511 (-),score=168.86 TRINITY_DN2327_c0_g1_i1:331-1863(-)
MSSGQSEENVHKFKIYATGPGFSKDKYWMGRFNLANPELIEKEESGAKLTLVKEGNKRKINDSAGGAFTMQGQPDSMGSSALAGYFVLMRQGDGQFVTIPANEWYSFKPFRQTVETLEEVEEAMINKRVGAVRRAVPVPLSQQKKDEEEEEDGEGGKKKGKPKKIQVEDDGLMLKKGGAAKKKKKPSGDVDEVLDGGDDDVEKGADLDGAMGEEADRAEDWDFVEDVANDDLGMAPDMDLELKDEEDDLEDDDKKKLAKNEDLMEQVNIKDEGEEDADLTEEGKKLKEIIEKQDGTNSGDETTKSRSLEDDKSRSKSTDSADEKEIDVQEFLGVKKQEKQENANTPPNSSTPPQNSVKRKVDDVPDLMSNKKAKTDKKVVKNEQAEVKTESKAIKKEPVEQKYPPAKKENNAVKKEAVAVKKEVTVKKEEQSNQKQKNKNQGNNNNKGEQQITEQEIIDYVKSNKATASALSSHFRSRLQKSGAQGREHFKEMVKKLVRQDKETKLLNLK